jgi:hypothetical protein
MFGYLVENWTILIPIILPINTFLRLLPIFFQYRLFQTHLQSLYILLSPNYNYHYLTLSLVTLAFPYVYYVDCIAVLAWLSAQSQPMARITLREQQNANFLEMSFQPLQRMSSLWYLQGFCLHIAGFWNHARTTVKAK